MSSVRGVNVGGNLFDVTDTSNVAPFNSGSFAVRNYAMGRFLIMEDGLLYKATVGITSGDPLVVNGNIKRTNLDEVLANISSDINFDMIAPTENDSTSSADYAIGEQILRSGLLYKVISAIEEEDTFVVGNNIELSGSVTEQLNSLNGALTNLKMLKITTSSFSSLPQTISNAKITANHEVVNSVLSNLSAITSDITWTTANGSITLNGTISGSTSITLYLMKSET